MSLWHYSTHSKKELKMMFVIRTQFMENYGAHDWDGTGTCPQHWKMKGGSEYKITGVDVTADPQDYINIAGVEFNDIGAREYIVSYSFESDDYLSDFEKSQLKYDGEIYFCEPYLSWAEMEDQVLNSSSTEIVFNREVKELA
jgi:hypothetical protein